MEWNPEGKGRYDPRMRTLKLLLLLIVLLCSGSGTASATSWLCPSCLQPVEREVGTDLDCAGCGAHFVPDDLSWITAYANYRTRDVELNWLLLPEDCGIFNAEGLQAFMHPRQEVWVPWTAVYWYLPRMRIVKLTDGRELGTDYAKSPEHCPFPPKFLFEFADSVHIDGQKPRAFQQEVEASLSELFFVAEIPKAMKEARARFIREVEAGNHPRLPRTDARLQREAAVVVPASAKGSKGTVEIDVRANDKGQILRVHVVKSSGAPDLDRACASAAQSSGYFPAGEMGIPVPATVRLVYTIKDGVATVESKPAVPMIWEP